MSSNPQSATPPHVQIAAMSRWYVVSRAIHAVAKLKIANVIGDTPIHIQKIADSFNKSIDEIIQNPVELENATLTKLSKKY